MTISESPSATVRTVASGHHVRSVVADDEPPAQRRRALADLASALPAQDAMSAAGARVLAVATTPDFHPGRPVPVGVVVSTRGAVLPHLVGNDVGCGMHLLALDGVSEEDVADAGGLDDRLRHAFFRGGRDVALRGRDRHAVLREGLPGLFSGMESERRGVLGRLDTADAWRDADRTSGGGFFVTWSVEPAFAAWADSRPDFSHDSILGTIGGGNHFVEIGVVDHLADGGFALACGLRRGTVVVVVHSGSLDFGQRAGSLARSRNGGAGDPRIVSLEGDGAFAERWLDAHACAANVAHANRWLLGVVAAEAVRGATGRDVGRRLVWDAPHNSVWRDGDDFLHRKGACPAGGPDDMRGTPYAGVGEPVILPGSMGDGTWVLVGKGSATALGSSAHGAGRRLSRGEARRKGFVPSELRVVGPVDPRHPSMAGRRDVAAEMDARMREESPSAYRPLEDVVVPMVAAGMVARGLRIRPLLTVKG